MFLRIPAFVIFGVVLFGVGCVKPKIISYDQQLAGKRAQEFANIAFVKRDFEGAHKLLPKELDPSFDVAALKKFVWDMHPTDKFPEVVLAEDYEIVIGQEKVNIYLEGKRDAENLHYLLVMGGNKSEGYRVTEMYRSDTPYPANNLRTPLK
jgi:hypothetical protein